MSEWNKFNPLAPPFGPKEAVDIVAKKWDPLTDKFIWRRFTDVVYTKTGIITPGNLTPGIQWPAMLEGWHPLFWMHIPELPKVD